MAEVKWIRLNTDMFDNAKIKYLRTLPEGDKIVLIWVMLLAKAGKCNSNGFIFLTESIPYTAEMLAAEFDFEITTIQLALGSLSKLGMINLEEHHICITGWEEHQNIEGLDKIREQTRLRMAKYRERKKALPSGYVTSDVTVTQGDETEEEREEDKERDTDNNTISKDIISSTKVQPVIDRWNSLNLQKLVCIKEGTNRYKLLNARIKDYGMDSVLKAIDMIDESSFLKGDNYKGWTITFDWLIKPNNFIKVLEGNYSDKQEKPSTEPKKAPPQYQYLD